MITSKIFNELTYIVGRITALASRPLMLLFLNNLVNNDLASLVAVFFLVSILGTSLSGFDTHRDFYQAYFRSHKNRGIRSTYQLYSSTIVLQVIIVAPLISAFILYRMSDLVLAVFVTLYFISERLADESQRFLILKGSRKEWARRIIVKTTVQLFGVCASAYILGPDASRSIAFFLMFGNLVAYAGKLPLRYLSLRKRNLKSAITGCFNHRLYWLLSLITTFLSHFDRVIVMLFKQSDMAFYMVLVSSMSILQNFVDYFFLTPRRKDILQGRFWPRDLFLDQKFYITLGIGALAACLVSWVMTRLYHSPQISDFQIITIVFISQSILAITLLLKEMLYWNLSVHKFVWVEGGFILLCLITATTMRLMDFHYQMVLSAIALFLSFRLGWMIWVIAPANSSFKLLR